MSFRRHAVTFALCAVLTGAGFFAAGCSSDQPTSGQTQPPQPSTVPSEVDAPNQPTIDPSQVPSVDPTAPTDGTQQTSDPSFPDPQPKVAITADSVRVVGKKIIIGFRGEGKPGYGVQYTQVADDATGQPVDLNKPKHIVQIVLTGATNGPAQTLHASGDGPIGEVRSTTPASGLVTIYAGLDARRPFTVALTDNQLVVEFA